MDRSVALLTVNIYMAGLIFTVLHHQPRLLLTALPSSMSPTVHSAEADRVPWDTSHTPISVNLENPISMTSPGQDATLIRGDLYPCRSNEQPISSDPRKRSSIGFRLLKTTCVCGGRFCSHISVRGN